MPSVGRKACGNETPLLPPAFAGGQLAIRQGNLPKLVGPLKVEGRLRDKTDQDQNWRDDVDDVVQQKQAHAGGGWRTEDRAHE